MPARTYRPELDGIRGVAVLLVVAFHARLPLVSGSAGTFGVTLFFVLSGYLITGILLEERDRVGRISLRSFYARRVRRLLPALVAVVGFVGIVSVALGAAALYVPTALAALFYVANLSTPAFDVYPYLGATWSLSLEEQFYAIWPVALIALGRRAVWLAVAGIVVVNGIRAVIPITDDTMFQPQFRADAVLWGCLLAFARLRVPRVASAAWLAVPAIAVSALALPLALPAMALVSVALVATAASVPFLRWRWLVRVGQISYGLYLWHYPVAVVLRNPANPIALVAIVAISLALALVSERWFERPFRLRRHAVADDRVVVGRVVGEGAL